MTAAIPPFSALHATAPARPVAPVRTVRFPPTSPPAARAAAEDGVAWSWGAGSPPAARADAGPYGFPSRAIRLASFRAAFAREGVPEDAAAPAVEDAEDAGTAAPSDAGPSVAAPGVAAPADAPADGDDDEADAEGGEAVEDGEQPADGGRTDGRALTEEEQQVVEELKQTDQEVRRHEQAHLAASGGYARGGATYEYQQGPDGRRYAVGGEVSIDTSKESSPEATIRKMRTVRSAALAPADPSGQDRAVAAQATAMEQEARAELAEQQRAAGNGERGDAGETESDAPAGETPPETSGETPDAGASARKTA